ncbi:MAG TPA: polysaccharide deacetylase family protein, partial [Candidatus Krumholzibacteria bacterium]|nr:polysaccharide deacetylase family protein [Candidatus Krumholzibacteria bacterium]
MAGRFPVLMYHRLESPECPVDSAQERPWSVPLAEFDRQMARLRETGRLGVSMDQIHSELAAGRDVPAAWVGLTFDDGNASDYRHALPVLTGYGFHATFFVCADRIQGEMPPAQLRELRAAGM